MNREFVIMFLGEGLEVSESPIKITAYSKEEAVEKAMGIAPDKWDGNTFFFSGKLVGSCDPAKVGTR